MKNGFYVLILFHLLALTSCESDHDSSLTDVRSITDEIALKDSAPEELPFSLFHPDLEDSSKYFFFVENEAGRFDYQRYDFNHNTWRPLSSLFQRSFMGGPLHTGRIIHQHTLWRDSVRYLLYGKDVKRGMALEVVPLAELKINNDPEQSVYIFVPEEREYRLSDCNHFDDWFTYCNQQRFFVQYWIEQQFRSRYIRRIQWKPFSISDF